MLSRSIVVFACYSAACRPPNSGGTGGSIKGVGVGGPAYVAPGATHETTALVGAARTAFQTALTGTFAAQPALYAKAELAINAAGQRVKDEIGQALKNDTHYVEMNSALDTMRAEGVAHDAERSRLWKEMQSAPPETQAALRQAYFATEGRPARLSFTTEKEMVRALIARRAEVIAGVMSQYRPMGGVIDGTPAHRATKTGLSVGQQLDHVRKLYPTEWLKLSNDAHTSATDATVTGNRRAPDGTWERYQQAVKYLHPLVFRTTQSRAHYLESKILSESAQKYKIVNGVPHKTHMVDEITLNGTHGTAVHEFFHRMEHVVPGLGAVEQAFMNRRSQAEGNQPIQGMGAGGGPGRAERRRPAGLFDPYAERVYEGGRYHEVGSMGWEYYTGSKTSHGKSPDPDHLGTVIGAMLTV